MSPGTWPNSPTFPRFPKSATKHLDVKMPQLNFPDDIDSLTFPRLQAFLGLFNDLSRIPRHFHVSRNSVKAVTPKTSMPTKARNRTSTLRHRRLHGDPLRQVIVPQSEALTQLRSRPREIPQVDRLPSGEPRPPPAKRADGHDGVVTVRQQRKIELRRPVRKPRKHHDGIWRSRRQENVLGAPREVVGADHENDAAVLPDKIPHRAPEVRAVGHRVPDTTVQIGYLFLFIYL